MSTASRRTAAVAALTATAIALAPATAAQAGGPSVAGAQAGGFPALAGRACPPRALAVNFGDGLDKLVVDGITVGGLSDMAYDWRSGSWVSTVDNHGADPARLWFWNNPLKPTATRDPVVLRRPDGTAYDGTTSDNEGLAVLPDGDFLVSSETEPSIRIYGRDGVEKSSLPVPARFAVTGHTPGGQATGNATLEGLTITPSGRRVIAAMEGALSGDVSVGGDATAHRFLVYDRDRHGTWRLTRQIGYRTAVGNRIPEVQAYGDDSLLVEEASFSTGSGNAVSLYAVTGLDRAVDVTAVANLSTAPAADIVRKSLVADLVRCPTLGAPAKQTQANPLLDNFEGMAVLGGPGPATVSLISDDNFGATQTTRVLNLAALLP